MSTYKNREELYNDSNLKTDNDWHNWISTLLINPNKVKGKLYHISFNNKLPKTVTPQPVYATDGVKHMLYNERLPPRLSTSNSVIGCWRGIYANYSNLFENEPDKDKPIKIFVYEVTPHIDALLLTPETATKEWLIYDAHVTHEYSIFGDCDLKLLGEVILKNTTNEPNAHWDTFNPYNLKKYNILYSNPPFIMLSNTLPNNVTLENINSHYTENQMYDVILSKVDEANEFDLQSISTEAYNLPFKAITDKIKRSLHNVIGNVPTFNSSTTSEVNNVVKAFKQGNSDNATKTFNYLEIKDILVIVPVGFTGDYLGYFNMLLKQFEVMSNLVDDVIKPTHNLVLKYIGKPESMTTIDNADIEKVKLHDAQIESFKKDMNKYFDSRRNHQTLPISKLVRNANELQELFKTISMEIKGPMVDIKCHDAIFTSYQQLQKSLDLLMVRIEQNPDVYKLNKLNAERLARLINDVAVEIEVRAALHSYLKQFVECAIAVQQVIINNSND